MEISMYNKKVDPKRVKILFSPNNEELHGLIDGIPSFKMTGDEADKTFYEALDSGFNVELIDFKMDKKDKIRQFHAILAKKGLMDLKADLLASYSARSTKELNEHQLDELINRLQTVQVSHDLRESRSLVLTLLSKLGITGSKEDGWNRVNEYLLQPRISGKQLYEMNETELTDCSKRLRAIIGKR